MIGLYVSFTPEGKIKRHLSAEMGEVPLEDTVFLTLAEAEEALEKWISQHELPKEE